jgi:hypothetical protein
VNTDRIGYPLVRQDQAIADPLGRSRTPTRLDIVLAAAKARPFGGTRLLGRHRQRCREILICRKYQR